MPNGGGPGPQGSGPPPRPAPEGPSGSTAGHRAAVHALGPGRPEDAATLARMQFAAWLETYPGAAPGIDEQWIREHRGELLTEEGAAGWRAFLGQVSDRPRSAFCQVARAPEGALTAVLCGLREAAEPTAGTAAHPLPPGPPPEIVTLGPMYVLRRAQGLGIGSRLMDAFLAWAGEVPIRLWVTASNEGAIRFYRRHGFTPTGECHLWRDRLPNIRMVRDGGG
ncbi:GNAT family N-acetyltransferase [Streptomyces catenulae]|uniref:GNAT family N-acetyltransferase n=1 Tax=Streptomyces catenulae TaxID=66875 RepID=A0ABV2Z6S0_9ACTN|nr:GNAT family N-acetyltransferase [Streptomyces catenulae]